MVFDLGGGTMDASFMRIRDEYRNDVDVVSLKNDLELVSKKHENQIKKET